MNDLDARLAQLHARVHTVSKVAELRAAGHSLGETARRLNVAGVPTPSGAGSRWYPATVDRVERPAHYAQYQRAYRQHGARR